MSNTSKFAYAKITGKQVALLQARAAAVGYHGQSLLEWLEFECYIAVNQLEDIVVAQLDFILAKLEKEKK